METRNLSSFYYVSKAFFLSLYLASLYHSLDIKKTSLFLKSNFADVAEEGKIVLSVKIVHAEYWIFTREVSVLLPPMKINPGCVSESHLIDLLDPYANLCM